MKLEPLDAANALPNLLARQARERPQAPFITDVDRGETWGYGEFEARVRTWAARLAGLGVGEGDTVVVLLTGRPEAITIWLALARLGAIEVPLNPAYQGNLLTHMITNAGARVAITDEAHIDPVLAIESELPELERIVTLDGATRAAGSLAVTAAGDLDSSAAVPDRTAQPWEVACVMYTSGTTGPSKGVVVPWAQVYMTSTGSIPLDDLTDADHWYIPYPLFHMAGKMCVGAAALRGSKAVIRGRFSLSRFWADIDEHECTSALLIGTVPQLVNSRERRPDDASHHLVNAEMAPMPADPADFAARFGVRVCTIFNMTELSCPVMTRFDPFPPESVGRLRDGYEIRIVDEHDMEVPTGTIGEITVRSRWPWVMNLGYWRMPEKSIEAWLNGWFHTGDAGYVDADGFYYFVDRLKDAIRVRGENISSMELEAEIGEFPGVGEVAAIGVPAEMGEEDVAAFVVPEAPDLDPAALHAFCAERLPAFMVPRYVAVVDSLPKTPTEKVRKPVLRESWDPASTWDAKAPDRG
jgi:carnitine-CoA ligase